LQIINLLANKPSKLQPKARAATPKKSLKSPKTKRPSSPKKGSAVLLVSSDSGGLPSPAVTPKGGSLASRMARRRLDRSAPLHSLVSESIGNESLSAGESEGEHETGEHSGVQSARETLDEVLGTVRTPRDTSSLESMLQAAASFDTEWDTEVDTEFEPFFEAGRAQPGAAGYIEPVCIVLPDAGSSSAEGGSAPDLDDGRFSPDAVAAPALPPTAALAAGKKKKAVAKRRAKVVDLAEHEPEYEQNWSEDAEGKRRSNAKWLEDQMKLTQELQEQYGLPISK